MFSIINSSINTMSTKILVWPTGACCLATHLLVKTLNDIQLVFC